MATTRRQFNVRADDETARTVDELIPAVSAAIGLPVSQSDLFRLGMQELRRKYLPAPEPKKGRAK